MGSNTFTFLYPYIDKMIQEVDFENCAPMVVFDKDVDPAGGLTGRIPRTYKNVAAAFTPSMYVTSGSAVTVSGINYTVDQSYVSKVSLTFDEGLALGSRMNDTVGAQVQEAVRAILKAMNSGFYASGTVGGYYRPGISNAVGTAGTTPLATPWADIINVNTALERNMCPQDGRVGILDLAAWSNILNATGLTNFYASNSDATLRSAKVGRLFNFDVVNDQLVPVRTVVSSGFTGGYHFSGTLASGDLFAYMFTSGCVGATGVTPAVGDIFWFTGIGNGSAVVASTGYGQSFVITSGTVYAETGVGKGIAQYFYPRFPGSGTTLGNIVWAHTSGNQRRNVFGHKSAMRLVMRDPRQGMAGMPQIGESVLYTDPKTQVPVLVTFIPGNGMVTIEVRAIWTWVCVKPEWACILQG